MRLELRRILAISAALLLPACAGMNLRQDFPPAEAAVPSPGEHWTYRIVNGYNGLEIGTARHEVVKADQDRFELRITDGKSGTGETRGYVRGWNPESGQYPVGLAMGGFWNGIPPGGSVRYLPPLPDFRFPLAPGRSWSETVVAADPATGQQIPVKVLGRVQGMERIRVPAGEFDAIKVTRDHYYQDATWWRTSVWQTTTDWYAPSINRVVRHREHSQYTDLSRGGRDGGVGLVIYGDYLVHELAELSPVRR
ncbi:MAG TPA: hypothetical protein VFP70_14005 [Burkholderiales bacterium]|nr:hypothetical protein [Burkholderiales bacterium]